MVKKKIILDYIDAIRDEIIDFAKELIRVPTVNPPGENYENCAKLIEKKLNEIGFDVNIIEVPEEMLPELAPHAKGLPRPNVLAELKGAKAKPIMHLNGHYDVVPAGTGWTKDPFTPVIEDAKLYGRGAADQKCGLVAAIMAAKALRESDVRLKGNLTLSATPDEETGGFAGLGYLVKEGHIKADYAIITEPTGINGIISVSSGHRGALWLEITIYGQAAHSCQPFLGINAFDKMLEVASAIKAELEPKFRGKLSKYPVEPAGGRYPTLCLGGIATCGAKINMVPDKSMFTVDRRLIPEESLEDAINEINLVIEGVRKRDPKLKVNVKKVFAMNPVIIPADHPLINTIKNIAQEVGGRELKVFVDAGFDDRRFLINAQIPALAYGPGQVTMCHVADEHCYVSHLIVSAKVLALTMLTLLG